MKKILTIRGRSKDRRNDGKTPLIKESNNNVQDGYDPEDKGYDTPLAQNTLNTSKEVAKVLNVASNTCDDEHCLIQKWVSKHFPKPPTPDQNLNQHLVHVQEAVLHELLRLGPLLKLKGLMGFLIDCYHRQTFDHLHSLLQNATSTQNSFVLMNWVLHIYQSEELLGHPDLQEIDPINQVDHLLVSEWEEKAKVKLLENVEREVRQSLAKILQIEIGQECCDHEEDYVRLYVDTIQCIDAMHNEAKKISSDLSDEVQHVCFKRLLIFVRRYSAEQTEALGKKAEMDEPETIHFLKTLKTCKELKWYVQTTGKKNHLVTEIVETLKNMEASTWRLLMGIVADIAEVDCSAIEAENMRSIGMLVNGDVVFISFGAGENQMMYMVMTSGLQNAWSRQRSGVMWCNARHLRLRDFGRGVCFSAGRQERDSAVTAL
ncbi:exocyst complex component 3-like protein 4 isoform X1 [Lates japonicus]|uniref:Exocyst complex component 3-like protein 4 isoform X1 n=1 Tax=Lates japonicus TaxID=270547 RepID=A0AAD3NL18_LATJO|nr:exocyst complex component 3-like protein 4 isoform X1 [Lates japonicus]